MTTQGEGTRAMLDDFFVRALLAGAGVAAVAGPLGCFIVWRRAAFFGDMLGHAALLGVALSILLHVSVTTGVFVIAVAAALALVRLMDAGAHTSDTLLGILSHGSLALGLLVLSVAGGVQVDLQGLLFGDILAVGTGDLALIFGGGVAVLSVLALFWRTLFAASVSPEIAAAEGLKPKRAELAFTLVLAAFVAVAMKIVGVLLITALMVMPAAAARRFVSGPEAMALLASVFGIMASAGGLFGSLRFDTPSGPSIVAAAFLIFAVSISPLAGLQSAFRRGPRDEP